MTYTQIMRATEKYGVSFDLNHDEWVRGYVDGFEQRRPRKRDKGRSVYTKGILAGRAERAVQFRTAGFRNKLAEAVEANS